MLYENGEKRSFLLASFPALLLCWGATAVMTGAFGEAALLDPLVPKASVRVLMAVQACKNCEGEER